MSPRPPRLSLALALLAAGLAAPVAAQCLLQSFTVTAVPQPTVQGNRIASAGDILVSTAFDAADPLGFPIFVWRRAAGAWQLEATLHLPSTFGGESDQVGTDGQTIVVVRSGGMYVYVDDAGAWALQTAFTTGFDSWTGHPEIEGDRLACKLNVYALQKTGVRVLRRTAGQWVEEDTMLPDLFTNDGFNGGLSLHGDLLAAGAHSDNTAGSNAGAVYVFRFDGAAWNQEAKLLGDGKDDLFGDSVAIEGDDLVVGAREIVGTGYVKFFHHESGAWTPVLTWTDPSAGLGANIGKDVDLQAGLVAVGMRGYDVLAANDGAVAALRKVAGVWTHVTTLSDPAPDGGGQLGWDVAVNGETILASARVATGTVPTQGRLYAFGGVPGAAAFTDLGGALAGAGTPCLVGDGLPAAGEIVRFVVAHAPSGPAWFLAGGQFLGLPFKGGTLVPQPDLVLPGFAAGPEGLFELAGPWPPWVAPGQQVYLQAWIADAAGPHGFSASNGLQVTSF